MTGIYPPSGFAFSEVTNGYDMSGALAVGCDANYIKENGGNCANLDLDVIDGILSELGAVIKELGGTYDCTKLTNLADTIKGYVTTQSGGDTNVSGVRLDIDGAASELVLGVTEDGTEQTDTLSFASLLSTDANNALAVSANDGLFYVDGAGGGVPDASPIRFANSAERLSATPSYTVTQADIDNNRVFIDADTGNIYNLRALPQTDAANWQELSASGGSGVGDGDPDGIDAPLFSYWGITRVDNTPVDLKTEVFDIVGPGRPTYIQNAHNQVIDVIRTDGGSTSPLAPGDQMWYPVGVGAGVSPDSNRVPLYTGRGWIDGTWEWIVDPDNSTRNSPSEYRTAGNAIAAMQQYHVLVPQTVEYKAGAIGTNDGWNNSQNFDVTVDGKGVSLGRVQATGGRVKIKNMSIDKITVRGSGAIVEYGENVSVGQVELLSGGKFIPLSDSLIFETLTINAGVDPSIKIFTSGVGSLFEADINYSEINADVSVFAYASKSSQIKLKGDINWTSMHSNSSTLIAEDYGEISIDRNADIKGPSGTASGAVVTATRRGVINIGVTGGIDIDSSVAGGTAFKAERGGRVNNADGANDGPNITTFSNPPLDVLGNQDGLVSTY